MQLWTSLVVRPMPMVSIEMSRDQDGLSIPSYLPILAVLEMVGRPSGYIDHGLAGASFDTLKLDSLHRHGFRARR